MIKKRIKRKKGNKPSVRYFTEDTEMSINNFNLTEDVEEKNKIYTEEIKPALLKLVENTIFVHKFHNLDDTDILKNDCVSFLFETLHKFDASRGHKAFSYLSVVAKNWFTQKSKSSQKDRSTDVHFDKNVLNYLEKSNNENVVFSYEDQFYRAEFMELLKEDVKKWRNKFEKPQEKKVLEAVILLLENPDLINIYNKKAVFLYLKEITNLNTKQIVTNLKKMGKKYTLLKNRYQSEDYLL